MSATLGFKAVGQRFIKKGFRQLLSYEFFKIFQNIFVIEHLQSTASDKISIKFDGCLLFLFISRMKTEVIKRDLRHGILCNDMDILHQLNKCCGIFLEFLARCTFTVNQFFMVN